MEGCISCPIYVKEKNKVLKENPSAIDAASQMWDFCDRCVSTHVRDGVCEINDVYNNEDQIGLV